MVKVKGIFEKAYLFVILAILYAPILLIIVYSFSNSSNFRFDEGFTFEAYIPSSLPRSRPLCGTRWATPSSSRRCLR